MERKHHSTFPMLNVHYAQFRSSGLKQAVEAALEEAGQLAAINFTPHGPAGIFGLYTLPGANLGFVLANEFFVVSTRLNVLGGPGELGAWLLALHQPYRPSLYRPSSVR